MRNFTSMWKTVFTALFAVLAGAQTIGAAENPSVEELYGRYTFKGDFQGDFMDGAGSPVEAPFHATTDYDMVILPGSNKNEVQMLGFFCSGGVVTLTYNREEGTLKAAVPEVCFTMAGTLMLTASGEWPDYPEGQPENLEFSYSVSKSQDGGIVVKADNALENVTYMDMAGGVMGAASYAAGYTLTKNDVAFDIANVGGTYEFVADYVDGMNLLPDASEWFDLNVVASAADEGMVELDGWFGFSNTKVEAKYYADGGILVLPHDAKLDNGMYFGLQPAEDGGYNPNPAPFFFVGDGKMSSYSYFTLYGGFDEVMEMALSFSVVGGTATGKGESVDGYRAGRVKVYATDGAIRVEGADDAGIRVYDAQGMAVASAEGETAVFNGLKSGLYLVKASGRTVKVVVK